MGGNHTFKKTANCIYNESLIIYFHIRKGLVINLVSRKIQVLVLFYCFPSLPQAERKSCRKRIGNPSPQLINLCKTSYQSTNRKFQFYAFEKVVFSCNFTHFLFTINHISVRVIHKKQFQIDEFGLDVILPM